MNSTPDQIPALLQLGWRLHQSGQIAVAQQHYQQALAIDDQHADAWVYLGIALFDQRHFESSVDAYRKALQIQSVYPIAWNNLGNSLRMLGRSDEAEECFETALRQRPGYLSALKNRGTLWVWAGQIERGLQWYRQGLSHDPDNAELHRNLGVIHLLLGNYDVAWPEYRWRWQMADMGRPAVAAPIWQGQPLAGRTILLYPEQGLGDAIHFVRVAKRLSDSGARVLLQCPAKLIPLFSSTRGDAGLGIDQLIPESAPIPPVDYHASLIEVVDVLYTQTGQIAWCEELFQQRPGYLHVSDELVQYWRRWLDNQDQPCNSVGIRKRIGINWQGNPEHQADVYRSLPLAALRPLSQLPGVQLVNLQFGHGSEQLDDCEFADSILRLPDHFDATEGAFTDTAALLRSLDHVVTSDTAVAHLAGAVGAATTVILGKVPDWRWLQEGDTTRWYPTMRLVRQQTFGHWDDVAEQVAATLVDL